MLAHPARGHNVNGAGLPAQMGKRPTTFMFIDSSNGGVNAKPDKVVRSFVMKSARNKKSWSTRPKSPKVATPSKDRPRRRSSSRTQSSIGQVQNFEQLPRLECNIYTDSWDKQRVTSPSCSSGNSIFSSSSSNRTCDSPLSTYTSPYTEPQHAEDTHRFPGYWQLASVRQDRPAIGSLKSLDCLAVRLDAGTERLLHQFVEASTPRLLPIDPHKTSAIAATDWIARCIQSPIGAPFIYAALTSSARTYTRSNSEVYKWRAISEVNKLLSDLRSCTHDTTIAAVLVLLALEEAELADPNKKGDERRCSVTMNEAHLNGLRTMITQRGGLVALSGNRCLQVCILMYSVAQTITTFRHPYAMLYNTNGQIDDYLSISTQCPSSLSHILQPFHHLNLDRALFDIISTTAVFTSDLNTWYETGSSPIDALDLQKHASLLMYRLFAWYQQSKSKSSHQHMRPLEQSICLALLIFMVHATEPNAQSFGSRLSKAVSLLRDALENTPVLAWSHAPDVLLWTTTMGELGANSLPRSAGKQVSFFARYYTSAFPFPCYDAQRRSAEDLLPQLRKGLWIPSVFDLRAKKVWIKMELCGAEALDLIDDVDSTSSEADCGQVVEDEYALGQSTTMRFFRGGGE